MFMKTRYVREISGGAAIVFATGTPVSKIKEVKRRLEDPQFNARVTAVAVFMALYLAVGFGFVAEGWVWYFALTWAYAFVKSFTALAVFTLTSFIAVAYYVYRLKLAFAVQSVMRLDDLVGEMGDWRDKIKSADGAVEAVRKDADSRVAAAEQAARLAVEAKDWRKNGLPMRRPIPEWCRTNPRRAAMQNLLRQGGYSRVYIILRM